MDIIVGTAGHIDHGKTALVKALTGVDADRLPEEKERGITIDIGFAELSIDELHFGFVDVPGHERFVKNMLAGASGIDLVLLVIAADEGVMPQTREHFEICRLLDIKAGVIVLTKSDRVDTEPLELAKMEAADLVASSFLTNAEFVTVSARTGHGIDDLRRALISAAKNLPARHDDLVTRLPIDRRFTIKGHGAVVTGTVASGYIRHSDELELLPSGVRVRVRGLQTHGKDVDIVTSGQRAAVNLGGINSSEIERGMTLVQSGALRTTQIMDAEIEVLASASRALRSRQRARLSIGTAEVLARVQVLNRLREISPGAIDLVQLRLESPVVAVPGERFIIRSYSPQTTIAGGAVVDSMAVKHRSRDIEKVSFYLTQLAASKNLAERLLQFADDAGQRGISFNELQHRTGVRSDRLLEALNKCVEDRKLIGASDRIYIDRGAFEELRARTVSAIEEHHKKEPLSKGISRKTLREKKFTHLPAAIFREMLKSLEESKTIAVEGDVLRQASRSISLSPADEATRSKLEMIYKHAGLDVPKLDDAISQAINGSRTTKEQARKIFQLLINEGEVVKVSEEFYFSRTALDALQGNLNEYAAKSSDRSIDVPKFKEIAGISRKYAIPLLEYFDREKITRRAGDKRLIL